jgi:hypothetical protein
VDPVARLEVIVAVASLIPVLGDPVGVTTLAHPTTVDPHVVTTVPAPEARRPDVSGPRRRCFDNARRGRRDRDVDADAGGRRRGGAQKKSRRGHGRQGRNQESLE